MGTKNNPGEFDCYANADPDEPMFVLLGRDPDAVILVRLWALLRAHRNDPDDETKIKEAIACSDAMALWNLEHKNKPMLPGALLQSVVIPATTGLAEHPEGYEWPCDCDLCRSYA